MATPRRQVWQKKSACRNIIPDEYLIFETKRGRPSKNRPWEKYCQPCPVRQLCFNWALVHDAEGIWGGMTEIERENLVSGTTIKQNLTTKAINEGWFENYTEWYPKKWVDEMTDTFSPDTPAATSAELTDSAQSTITFEDLPEPFRLPSTEADHPNDLQAAS